MTFPPPADNGGASLGGALGAAITALVVEEVRFFPTQVVHPDTQGVKGYNDLWPRGGAAIDLFGNAG